MTDDEIIKIARTTQTAEGVDNGYILPIAFARAIEAALLAAPKEPSFALPLLLGDVT